MTPLRGGSRLERVCPRHGWAGWSYNRHRRRRFCRFCAYPERWDESSGRWVSAYEASTVAR